MVLHIERDWIIWSEIIHAISNRYISGRLGKGKGGGVSEIIFTLLAINTPLADPGKGGGVPEFIFTLLATNTQVADLGKMGGCSDFSIPLSSINTPVADLGREGGCTCFLMGLDPEFYQVLNFTYLTLLFSG